MKRKMGKKETIWGKTKNNEEIRCVFHINKNTWLINSIVYCCFLADHGFCLYFWEIPAYIQCSMMPAPVSHSMFPLTCWHVSLRTLWLCFFCNPQNICWLYVLEVWPSMKCGKPINGHIFKNNNFPSTSNYPLSLAPP